ncbi:septal ring lytic transglycosylase RlpA family protein [Candidatus Bipolaricaulota bacterium]|jgi:rare lipoprotein A|nr:septal ring lytic transglycosylase RlpA family protein [Candidatus Bipolaricaulota bacterium]TFH11598.1 MAG: septal ring lytic transglycosylase RlpA family protein [Candidatus Atribacteria bacterium]
MNQTLLYLLCSLLLVGAAAGLAFYGPYHEVGIASWYGPGFDGNLTANGEIYDMNGVSAAHKTLPFGTLVRVVEFDTRRSIVVRINDRGPFVEGRIIDLSKGAAAQLGIVDKGITKVGLRIVRWP